MARLSVAAGRSTILEIRLEPQAPAIGRPLRDLGLPDGCLVAGVLRGEEILVPRGAFALAEGDQVLLVARSEALGDALRVMVGEAP
jgi:Trk K+ transport system NAD-binding subunit